jgi:DedD protein
VEAAPKVAPKAAPTAAAEGQRPQEPKDGKSAASARVVVQVGAYGDATKAREVRQKLEKAGFKTYTQVVDGAGAKRTRVRVGPFASKAEADQAAARIKASGLPVAILTL